MDKRKPPIKQKYIESPEALLKIWDEYKAHIDKHPDVQEMATAKGVQVIRVKKPYMRQGFEAFVYRKYGHAVHQYIDNYQGNYSSYLGIVTCMRNEWQEDQIEGTLTGRYKAPNLVARLNGLVEKTDNVHNVNEIIVKHDR
jgi:hypothetical protein